MVDLGEGVEAVNFGGKGVLRRSIWAGFSTEFRGIPKALLSIIMAWEEVMENTSATLIRVVIEIINEPRFRHQCRRLANPPQRSRSVFISGVGAEEKCFSLELNDMRSGRQQ